MKISVVIPLYNKKEQVAHAIASVMAQTFPPLEIVVVNDGSTHGSELVVEALTNPLIRLIHQENGGVSAARNKGIELATGDWIAFLDADDQWKPAFLETMQLLANTYPQCKVVASAYELQDYRGIRKPAILHKIPFAGEHGILSNYFEVASCSHPPITSISLMVELKAIKNIGGFPVGVKSGEDLLTWARLAVTTKIAYSLKPLSVFIQDAAHTYDDKPNRLPDPTDQVGKELVKLYEKISKPERAAYRLYLSHWYKMRASIHLRLGMRINTLRDAFLSLRYHNGNKKVYAFILLTLLPLKMVNRLFKRFGIS